MNTTRRSLLKSGCCGLMSATPALSTLLNMELACASVNNTNPTDYKALVCILLSGGNDSWNMLVPHDDEPFKEYSRTRGALALNLNGSDGALPLAGSANSDRRFAVHPACRNIQKLFNSGKASFLSNVGTLIEPTTVKQYRAGSRQLPRSLFSHLDQRTQWQTAVPQSDARSGWIGRATELLIDNSQAAGKVSMNISLVGNNILQTGLNTMTPYSISSNGSLRMATTWLKRILQQSETRNLFEEEYRSLINNSIELEKEFSAAFEPTHITTDFPHSNKLAQELKAVAKTIAARQSLGHKRQTFFVTIDGWDHHQDLIRNHNSLLEQLDSALLSFNNTIEELGLSNNVTTFTISDFGRALVSNGNGTDHGWGGNSLIMGGAIQGAEILGTYPETLRIGNGMDIGHNGRLLPTTSCDEYFYELLRWFGVENTHFDVVLPNLNNFIPSKSETTSIGIYNAY